MSVQLDFLAGPFSSLSDVFARLSKLESALCEANDRRAVFASAYVVITRELKDRVDAQRFCDNRWVEQYAVCFANLYRCALLRYDGRMPSADLAPAWKIAFDTSAQRDGLVLNDLLLGVNAHVTYDLPLALSEVLTRSDCELRRQDFFAINQALHVAILQVRNRIEELYAPGLKRFNLLGWFQLAVVYLSFRRMRARAWATAVALDACSAPERTEVVAKISDQAAALSRQILAPTANSRFFGVLKLIEQGVRRTPYDPHSPQRLPGTTRHVRFSFNWNRFQSKQSSGQS